jgi:hypothetical protein
MSADRMKTLTYSAKKKKPKRMPEYSVAKPATISLSASGQVERRAVASAVAAMKKMMKARVLLEHVPVPEPAGLFLHDRVQGERTGEHDHADRRQAAAAARS